MRWPKRSGAPTIRTVISAEEASTTVGEPALDRIEQRILLDQVFDRVSGQTQFRKHGDRHRLRVGSFSPPPDRVALAVGSATWEVVTQAATRANPWA